MVICIKPCREAARPARSPKGSSAAAMALAPTRPRLPTSSINGSTNPHKPPKPVHATANRTIAPSHTKAAPTANMAKTPNRPTTRPLRKLAAIKPSTLSANNRP